MEILHRDDLPQGGFAGLREHRLVMGSKVYDERREPGTWEGIGNFVYLADARFLPKGETRLHSHREIDVISVMVTGRIAHQGSLQHGQKMRDTDVQVQRAGGEGFSHNEVNPDDSENRMIQLWVLPERSGEPAGYKLYRPRLGAMSRVYGGSTDQDATFDSHTLIDVGLLEAGQKASVSGPSLAYVMRGCGVVNGTAVSDGDLIRDEDLAFEATEEAHLILVHLRQ
ncbi:MAG: pirin family protein [Gammaproteobacteria bacterium]|jgi:redox-sensitive bicupin YhaK (pirin superfamily)